MMVIQKKCNAKHLKLLLKNVGVSAHCYFKIYKSYFRAAIWCIGLIL